MIGRPNIKWFRARAVEVSMALFIAYLTVNLIEYREAIRRADIPPTDWFVLNEIFVPDHEAGSDPSILYDRTILSNHRGFWIAEAQRVNPDGRMGLFQNACSGSGLDDYDRGEVLPKGNSVRWSWFFGRPCAVEPGVYRVQLTRDMSKPGYPVKQMRAWSSTFTVR